MSVILVSKGISVASTADGVFIRVVGRGSFQNSQPLRKFAVEMIAHGQRRFTVDIGECPTMDSTFLGVLAGIGLRLRETGPTTNGRLHVINASARNQALFTGLGLDRLLDMNGPAPAEFPPPSQLQCLPDTDLEQRRAALSKLGTASLMLDAHNNLIRVDQANAAKFESVTKLLRDTLAQPETETKGG